jgi:hypothetical protein
MPNHKFSLVACARWEETQIQEWIAYHQSIGFDHIYLYCNDDDPTALFRAIAPYAQGPDPYVTFRHWMHVGQQPEIYLHFLETFKHETEWFSFLDIDEFFVFKGIDNVSVFIRDHGGDADCLYFNWVLYGHAGKPRRDDGWTLISHPRRAIGPDNHTKMLCRSAALDPHVIKAAWAKHSVAFWHFLDSYQLPGVRCRDVLNTPMDGYSADFPASSARFLSRPGFAEAVLNKAYIAHFQFKSEEDFLRRWRRGGFPNSDHWRSVFETGEYKSILDPNNAVYDPYLAAHWHRYAASAMCMDVRQTPGSLQNVALHKPSWQSSIFRPDQQEPERSRVLGAANNGVRTGTYGFHTSHEQQPWWVVDLLGPRRIAEIHIYNRTDTPEVARRANELDVLASADGTQWVLLASRQEAEPFGLDGSPWIVRSKSADTAFRFVVTRLRSAGYLHLDEIEVYCAHT